MRLLEEHQWEEVRWLAEEKRMEEVEAERKWRLEELQRIQEVEKEDEEDKDEWEAGPRKKQKYKE